MKPLTPVPVVNLANLLTMIRIVLVPVFVLLLLAGGMVHTGWQLAACGAFVLASATDFADGWVARSRNLITSFGKVADPIADKALTGTALVLLSLFDRLDWWVTVVILVREWGITGLRFWVLRYGLIPTSRGGKVKTGLQILAIAWYLCPLPDALSAVGPWLMAAAVIVTVATGADYVVQAYKMRRAAALRRVTGPGGGPDGGPVIGSGGGPGGARPETAARPGAAAEVTARQPTDGAELGMLTGPLPAPAVAPQADGPVP